MLSFSRQASSIHCETERRSCSALSAMRERISTSRLTERATFILGGEWVLESREELMDVAALCVLGFFADAFADVFGERHALLGCAACDGDLEFIAPTDAVRTRLRFLRIHGNNY